MGLYVGFMANAVKLKARKIYDTALSWIHTVPASLRADALLLCRNYAQMEFYGLTEDSIVDKDVEASHGN